MRQARCWIDPQDFRDTRKAARLTVDQAARRLFVTGRTVRNWEAGRTRIPYAAYKLLKVLNGYALPGDAWEGWSLARGALWSPAGHRFLPGELAWLSLVFRQAEAFRALVQAQRRPPTEAHPLRGCRGCPPAQAAQRGTWHGGSL